MAEKTRQAVPMSGSRVPSHRSAVALLGSCPLSTSLQQLRSVDLWSREAKVRVTHINQHFNLAMTDFIILDTHVFKVGVLRPCLSYESLFFGEL